MGRPASGELEPDDAAGGGLVPAPGGGQLLDQPQAAPAVVVAGDVRAQGRSASFGSGVDDVDVERSRVVGDGDGDPSAGDAAGIGVPYGVRHQLGDKEERVVGARVF